MNDLVHARQRGLSRLACTWRGSWPHDPAGPFAGHCGPTRRRSARCGRRPAHV